MSVSSCLWSGLQRSAGRLWGSGNVDASAVQMLTVAPAPRPARDASSPAAGFHGDSDGGAAGNIVSSCILDGRGVACAVDGLLSAPMVACAWLTSGVLHRCPPRTGLWAR